IVGRDPPPVKRPTPVDGFVPNEHCVLPLSAVSILPYPPGKVHRRRGGLREGFSPAEQKAPRGSGFHFPWGSMLCDCRGGPSGGRPACFSLPAADQAPR